MLYFNFVFTFFLPGFLDLLDLLPGLGVVEGGVVVEEVSHEGQVELLDAGDDVGGGDEGPAVDLLGLVERALGAGGQVRALQGGLENGYDGLNSTLSLRKITFQIEFVFTSCSYSILTV